MRRFLLWLIPFALGPVGYAGLLAAAQPVHPPAPVPLAAKAADPAPVKADPPAKGKPRGLKPTPRHKLLAVKQFSPRAVALPASVTYVPAKLSMWDNDVDGICVTAEECFNQDAMGVFITDATCVPWARKNGYLDGATLTEVMDSMIASGFKQDGNTYSIGSYSAVNFSDEPTLQAALTIGPVKIGIDADALPGGAGNKSGWYATGGRVGQFTNEDHCVSIAGYGPATTLFSALNAPVPAGFSPTKTYYLLFTWSTIGVVDHEWIMSTTGEAFIRNPAATKNGQPNPPAPTPGPTPAPPGPTPNPTPGPVAGYTGQIAKVQTYVNGAKVGDEVTVVGFVGSGSAAVGDELKAAGVSPNIITDVLTLLNDLKAKKGFLVLLADVMAIIADLKASEPAPPIGRRDDLPWALAA